MFKVIVWGATITGRYVIIVTPHAIMTVARDDCDRNTTTDEITCIRSDRNENVVKIFFNRIEKEITDRTSFLNAMLQIMDSENFINLPIGYVDCESKKFPYNCIKFSESEDPINLLDATEWMIITGMAIHKNVKYTIDSLIFHSIGNVMLIGTAGSLHYAVSVELSPISTDALPISTCNVIHIRTEQNDVRLQVAINNEMIDINRCFTNKHYETAQFIDINQTNDEFYYAVHGVPNVCVPIISGMIFADL